jgi:hypothetical protein
MVKWTDISLYQFQEIQRLEDDQNLSDIDKALFSCCIVYKKTPHQLDNTNPRTVAGMLTNMKAVFGDQVKVEVPKKLAGHQVQYDIGEITFGQYVELEFYLTGIKQPILASHKAIASLCKRGTKGELIVKAEVFQKAKAYQALGALKEIKEKFNEFNNRFAGLFGLSPETHGEHISDPFNKRYGWTYSATTVAAHQGIPLQDAYRLSVVEAFSDLGFLKAKADYERKLYKTNNHHGG